MAKPKLAINANDSVKQLPKHMGTFYQYNVMYIALLMEH